METLAAGNVRTPVIVMRLSEPTVCLALVVAQHDAGASLDETRWRPGWKAELSRHRFVVTNHADPHTHDAA